MPQHSAAERLPHGPLLAFLDKDEETPLRQGVTDFCLLEDAGTPSLVAASDGSGLRLLGHVSGADFTEVPITGSLTGWENARQLIAEDQNGDGLQDLLGLTFDGTVVLSVTQTASPGFVPGPSYSLNFPAIDFTPIAWDDPLTDPALEVAYTSDSGLEVVDPANRVPL